MAVEGLWSGLLGALWLAALWQAAPILGSQPREYVDRFRDAIILGVAIPFVLGFAHLLYGALCFAAAVALWYARYRREQPAGAVGFSRPLGRAAVNGRDYTDDGPRLWLMLPVAVVAALALPALMQPPLGGDTLIYHLPNAAAWARAESVWDTSTTYWWLPGGSELFAGGLLACGAWWSVGLSGSVASVLLGVRITAWGMRLGAPAWSSAAIGAAAVSVPAAAIQAGNLGNDVWLAALFLESLWLLRARSDARSTLAVTAMVKPVGVVFACVAAVVGRARIAHVAVAAIPLGLWSARDAILWQHALVPPASTFVPQTMSTSIAMHGFAGLATLAVALAHAGAPTIIFLALPFAGLFLHDVRAQAVAGVAAIVAFALEPFGFASSLPQLASGASLRFALPAMAIGGIVATSLAARAPSVIGVLGLFATGFGVFKITLLYGNDHLARVTLPLVAAACAVITVARGSRRGALVPFVAAAAVVALGVLSASRAEGFYANSMRSEDGKPTAVFAWLRQTRPAAIVVEDMRSGAVSMMTPATRVYDLDVLSSACAQARARNALLAVGTDMAVPTIIRRRRFSDARRCGRVMFQDAAALIVEPGNQL